MQQNSGLRSNRKEATRDRVSGEFVGQVLTVDGEALTMVRAVDVSPRGFGFIIKREVAQGKHLWLEVGTYRIKVEVAYCESHLGIDGMFRCGVFARGADENLAKVFTELGFTEVARSAASAA